MSNSPNESSPSEPKRQTQPLEHEAASGNAPPSHAVHESQNMVPASITTPVGITGNVKPSPMRAMTAMDAGPYQSSPELQRRLEQIQAAQYFAYRRRHIRTSVTLFILTLLSTFLVGSGFFPLEYLFGLLIPRFGLFLQVFYKPLDVHELFLQSCRQGLEYAVPLMTILFCHEMGHYLQSVWNRVPASLPYFIPLPLPPMGTMGAVIFQGRGVATRKQMFDIAVWGPLAGLAVTIPVLWYGLQHSGYQARGDVSSLEFGEPLLLQWMIRTLHGEAPEGHVFVLNGIGFAGWVGVLITAMNLLPVGQLDGGHILYTLIGRKAHVVAYAVIFLGVAVMLKRQDFSFSLLLLLLMMTGPRHPPTANDREPLGLPRHILGWLTLSFLIIGFTPTPISAPKPEPDHNAEEKEDAMPDQASRTFRPGFFDEGGAGLFPAKRILG